MRTLSTTKSQTFATYTLVDKAGQRLDIRINMLFNPCSELHRINDRDSRVPRFIDGNPEGDSPEGRQQSLGGRKRNWEAKAARREAGVKRKAQKALARGRGCPRCGAGPGEPCMATAGVRAGLSVRMHPERYA